MYKLIIIDDEYYFRQSMKVKLPWGQLGFEICGEANNGESGLKLVEEVNPDVILLDINMPLMDGLEFCRLLKQKELKIHPIIVIISGYNDFNYAKSAIQYGVNNYLLKPINIDELTATIVEIKTHLHKTLISQQNLRDLERFVKQNEPLIKEKALIDLLMSSSVLSENRLMEISNDLQIPMSNHYCQVAIIEIDDTTQKNWSHADKQLWKFGLFNIATDMLDRPFSVQLCFDYRERLCCVFGYEQDNHALEALITNRLDQLRHMVQKYLKFTLTIGIGKPYAQIKNISSSYTEAIQCTRSKLITGCNSTFHYRSIENDKQMEALFSVESKSKLLISLRTNDRDETRRLLNDIFRSFTLKKINVDLIYAHCIEMFTLCIEFAVENQVDYQKLFQDDINPFVKIYNNNNIQEMEAWMQQAYDRVADDVHSIIKNKSTQIVSMIKAYIEQHYQDRSLTIESLSQHFYISYFHICRVFKQVSGSTLNEYISSYRIHKGKEMIDSGVVSISHIANKVGYEDPNYFSKRFKKTFGIAPIHYIKKKQL
ncbi:response regulator [Paenibacillus sp. PAMC21692]|uniref:response regulator n=1 Tax=Paenibacillus sp. PAMC21692 TaxID=2762320 RepID=UPI00164E9DA1|nr:response regulator [Paenibacillus sp. PAMC21692]QNK58942.1 response regulator [Paenibacillus sp. PAMC21692]